MAIGTSSDMRWLAVGGSGVQYTAGDGIAIDANNEISAKVDGTTITVNASGELEAIGGGSGSQVQANWAETDPSDPSYIENKPSIPTATSDLTNDSGYITSSDVPAAQEQADWNESNSSDPAYIKNKPSIPSATSDLTNDSGYITASDVPAAQEQSDWNESDSSDPAYIKNKPTIPAAQVNADWTASSGVAEILHKPTIPSATSDLTNDSGYITSSDVPAAQEQADWSETNLTDPAYIKNKPTIPAAQVNADWTASSGVAEILHKPSIPSATSDLTNDSGYITSSDVPGAQAQADWNESDTTDPSYIKNKPTIPSAVTVDQTYNSSSTNPQSGTAVAEAIAGVRQVPTTQSTDNGKMLGVTDANGTLGWVAQVKSDWTETDSTDPSYIQHKPAETTLVAGSNITLTESGSTLTISASGVSVTVDQTYDSTSANAQSGTAVAEAVSGKTDKVSGATNGNFAGLDSNGNLTDSGSKSSDFATSAQGSKADSAIQSVKVNGSALTPDANKAVDITVPAAQVNSDWNASSGVAEILNKPDLSVYATTSAMNTALATKQDTMSAGTGIDITNNAISVETPVDVVAGPGIVIDNPDGNTMRISCDEETVLFSGDLGVSSSTSLSESWHNFDRLKVYGYVTPGGGMAAEARTIDLESAIIDNTPCPDINLSTVASWSHRNDFNIIASVPVVFSANTTVTTLNGRLMGYWSGQWQVSFNETRIHVTKIVGIHRIANN